jgi:hypothetical protein
MIKKLLFLITSVIPDLIGGYVILDNVVPSFPKVLNLCEDIDPILEQTAYDVSENIPNFYVSSIHSVNINMNATGYICNQEDGHYGYMSYNHNTNNTNIWINNELLLTPNTLYNVLLHEVLHSFGLAHSDVEGMMNYSLSTNWLGYVKNDEKKLWISFDDIIGLSFLKYRK